MRSLFHHSAISIHLLAFALLAGCGQSDVDVTKVDGGRLGMISLLTPDSASQTYPVVLLVDKSDENADHYAQHIAAEGHSVILIDWSVASAATSATNEPCHFPIGDLEDFIQQTQTQQAYPKYVPPVIIGIGEGADAAYALLAQAPSLAIAGAIGIGRTGSLQMKGSFCNESAEARTGADAESYGPKENTNGWWRSVVDHNEASEKVFARATSGGDPKHPNTVVVSTQADRTERIEAALAAASAILRKDSKAPLDDLPITPLKAEKPSDVLAIIISGDGGWRDLDRQIGYALVNRNVSVVGLDSLHYFWQTKSPQKVADDLSRIIDFYSNAWGSKRVVLIGYSFGADVIPSAVDHMTAETRDRIDQISLLGMSDTTDYAIHVSGWLGVQPKGQPVGPDVEKLDMSLVQCFYGLDEDETFCTSPAMKAAEVHGLAGGHHFDGAYKHVADLILSGLKKRLVAPANNPALTEHPIVQQ
ncbi:MAG: virulence factor family protein [Parvibaculaceae bacterium]